MPPGHAAMLQAAMRDLTQRNITPGLMRYRYPAIEYWEVLRNNGDNTFDLTIQGHVMLRVPAIDPRARIFLQEGCGVAVRFYDLERQLPYIRAFAGKARRAALPVPPLTSPGWLTEGAWYGHGRFSTAVLADDAVALSATPLPVLDFTCSGQLRVYGEAGFAVGQEPEDDYGGETRKPYAIKTFNEAGGAVAFRFSSIWDQFTGVHDFGQVSSVPFGFSLTEDGQNAWTTWGGSTTSSPWARSLPLTNNGPANDGGPTCR